MIKYVNYRKSLDSKSKAKKEKKTSSSDQASLFTSRDSSVGFSSVASAGVSEARVTELICAQLGNFSSSFAASMQASFDNIRTFIEDKFASQDHAKSNPSFSALSPVPVDLGPHQTQTDPSVRSPCVDFGSGGEAQEPVQADSATSSFLASLRAAGIVVLQGVVVGNRIDRAPSPATVHGALVVAAQHEQLQEPLGGVRSASAAIAHPVPAVAVQGGQAQPALCSDGA